MPHPSALFALGWDSTCARILGFLRYPISVILSEVRRKPNVVEGPRAPPPHLELRREFSLRLSVSSRSPQAPSHHSLSLILVILSVSKDLLFPASPHPCHPVRSEGPAFSPHLPLPCHPERVRRQPNAVEGPWAWTTVHRPSRTPLRIRARLQARRNQHRNGAFRRRPRPLWEWHPSNLTAHH